MHFCQLNNEVNNAGLFAQQRRITMTMLDCYFDCKQSNYMSSLQGTIQMSRTSAK